MSASGRPGDVQVAIFGAGRIGKIHAGNLAAQPGVRLKHVVDPDAGAAAALAAKHGASVGTVEGVFADPSIRAVVIASSTDTHAELIERAAGAKKAIFCEKPVDLSYDRALRCARTVREAGVPCLIGFQRRYDPTFAAVRARMDAGEIGDPEMRWILGDEAESVYATGSCLTDPAVASVGDVDATAVTIRPKKGRLAQINTIRRAAYGYDQRFEVIGAKGMLQAGNHRPTEVVASTAESVSADKPEHFFLERYRVAYALEMAHFLDAIAHGKPIRTTIEDGVKALELAEAATISWREKRIVAL